jgi:hypothetical protein
MASSDFGEMLYGKVGGPRPRNQNRKNRNRPQVLDWDRNRDLIVRLYDTENRPLREVREIMLQDHKFDAT